MDLLIVFMPDFGCLLRGKDLLKNAGNSISKPSALAGPNLPGRNQPTGLVFIGV